MNWNNVVKALFATVLTGVVMNAHAVQARSVNEQIKPYSVGANLGMTSTGFLGGSAIQFSATADLGNPTSIKGLAFFPSVSYWSKSYNYGIFYDNLAVSIHELSFNVDGHYYFNPEARTKYYAGGGLGLSMISWGNDLLGYGGSAIALRMLGGVEAPISGGKLLVGQLTYVTRNYISEVSVNVGLRFNLTH